MIASQKDEIQGQRTRNEELDMQKNQTMLAEERVKSDLALTNERVRSLEEQLRSTKSDYQQSQNSLNEARDGMNRLEIRISELTSQLSDANMYKDMYERSQRDIDYEQRQHNEQLVAKENEIIELNTKISELSGAESTFKFEIDGLKQKIKELEEEAKTRSFISN